MTAPTLALSIRQPWAWLIVNGHKDIENRNWPTKFRGRIYVHAAKGMTDEEYEECSIVAMEAKSIIIPPFEQLLRGGIIGAVDITDCVKAHASPWFWGEYGFVLANAERIDFIPFRGTLGLFSVEGRL